MAGLDKRVASYEAALEGISNNMTVLAGGFGLCGIPENLIAEIRRRAVSGLTVVSNNCGVDGFGLGVPLSQPVIERRVGVIRRDSSPLSAAALALLEALRAAFPASGIVNE